MFGAMLNSEMQEGRTNVIKLSTVSEPAVRAVLAYLYCWDLTEPSENSELAVEMLKTADCYIIPRLHKDLRYILLTKPANWFSVDAALDLYLLSDQLNRTNLKLAAVQALNKKFHELKGNARYQQLFNEDPDTAKELYNAALPWLNPKPRIPAAVSGNRDVAQSLPLESMARRESLVNRRTDNRANGRPSPYQH